MNFCYRSRRRFGTVALLALAGVIGLHAVIGANGLLAYRAKRVQSAQLAQQLEELKRDNQRLAEHNRRLQENPDAIEGAIRQRLGYAKPNEVIVTVEDAK